MSSKTNNIQNYYLAEMHLFKENNAYFAFLPKKLQLFEVDETTYNILVNTREQFGTQTPIDTPDEDLIEAGLMYQGEGPEEDEMKTINEIRLAKIKENNVSIPVTNAVLQIAND